MKDITLTKSQQSALGNLTAFVADENSKVFILKGYAGTGKTTLMRIFIAELEKKGVEFSLLASTGRAAKILANATDVGTKTIHSEIYRFTNLSQDLEKMAKSREQNNVGPTGQLYLNFELTPRDSSANAGRHYYIVDESSMISDVPVKDATQALFGSGRLLHDLLGYDPCGKFIFVGDICQLPPVTQPFSPALDKEYFHSEYGITAYESTLTQIVRQNKDNDIALSAQKMRALFYDPQPWKWAKFPMRGYKNIHLLGSQYELINKYISVAKREGLNAATLVCFSNRQCSQTTQILRPAFGHLSSTLEKGDLLLVTQNNLISGLMNGDLVVVKEIGAQERRAGMTFVNVAVREHFSGRTYSQLMMSDVLYGNLTNITQTQQKELFVDFYYRMKDKGIKQGSDEFYRMMLKDPYLNALRAVFGYALTCHKSQGGEWDYVFLDIARSVPALQKPYVYQWVYTAMTRAKKELFLVDDFWIM